MIVKCPKCQARLRLPQTASASSLLVRCSSCQKKFKVRLQATFLQTLIGHDDPTVCQQLVDRIDSIGAKSQVCSSSADVLAQLNVEQNTVVLLDVAFGGSFPFQLIDKIKSAGNPLHKVVLLPSVYNRTAYKKRPDSLYGADAYLELHHIGDNLVPLLAELYPALAHRFDPASPVRTEGEERSLKHGDLIDKADSLAKLLVADILLYHQDRLEQGAESGELNQLFAEQLAEGRRMLAARLPEAADLPVDFIQQAFDAACQSYSCS